MAFCRDAYGGESNFTTTINVESINDINEEIVKDDVDKV